MPGDEPTPQPARRRRRRRAVAPGTAPGTLQMDPDAPRPRIHAIAYGPDRIEQRPIQNPEEIRALLGEMPVTWINVDGLGDADVLRQLAEIFNLHRLALEDVVNVTQRAKVEEYRQHLFIVTRIVSVSEQLESEQISLFLGGNFVLTFQERSGDCFDAVRERIRNGRGRIRHSGADYLAYALLDAVIDNYFPLLELFGERLEAIEDEVIHRAGRQTTAAIQAAKRNLLALRRTIWPQREAVNALLREAHPLFREETRLYLRDCYDHAVQIMDIVETYRELASGLMDFYLSTVSNRMNEVMKVLTIIATIFIPLSFIAGIYGMNFETDHPLNLPELKWRYGYFYCLGVMAAVAAALLLFFRRKGWIGGRDRE